MFVVYSKKKSESDHVFNGVFSTFDHAKDAIVHLGSEEPVDSEIETFNPEPGSIHQFDGDYVVFVISILNMNSGYNSKLPHAVEINPIVGEQLLENESRNSWKNRTKVNVVNDWFSYVADYDNTFRFLVMEAVVLDKIYFDGSIPEKVEKGRAEMLEKFPQKSG